MEFASTDTPTVLFCLVSTNLKIGVPIAFLKFHTFLIIYRLDKATCNIT